MQLAATYQKLSALLFNDFCLLSDMLQVLLHHVLMLVVHSQAKGVYVFTCCAILRYNSSASLADVMSPQHRYAHVHVRESFIVCQCKDRMCRVLGLAD